MCIVEYYLKYKHDEICFGSTMLKDNEDEDDAFPRFLQESYCPFKNFSKVFASYYSTAQALIKIIIDDYTHNSPGQNPNEAIESDMENIQYLLEELIKDGFSLSALNKKTGAEYILVFYDSRDPCRFHGRETTLKFLGRIFVPAH